MDFTVGDRVVCLIDGGGDREHHGPRAGQEGTIVAYKSIHPVLHYGVEFDQSIIDGHSLRGRITSGNGWWCSKDALVLIGQEEVAYTPDLSAVL